MIKLPWPPRVLSPNDRSHWTKKSASRAKQRSDAALIAGKKPHDGNIHLMITFCPPTKRAFDLDNALSSIKGALDGIADAWGVNDKCFRPVTIDFGPVEKGGAVYVETRRRLEG